MDPLRDLVGTCDPSSSSSNSLVGMTQNLSLVDRLMQEGKTDGSLAVPPPPEQVHPMANPDIQHEYRLMEESLNSEEAQKELEMMDSIWNESSDPMAEYGDWFKSFASYGQALEQKYDFSLENPFLQKGIQEGLVDIGIKLFHEGRLSEAIWAFEAFLQSSPNAPPEVVSDAWRWLGTANAENDNDQRAILCLRESTSVDPENLEALVDMGVCCTNELAQNEALACLRDWLKLHPSEEVRKIHQRGEMNRTDIGNVFTPNHRQVVEMYEEASRVQPGDSDIFSVLGVLYNLSRQYDMAEIAFTRALELDSGNYSLWNKLGATQANSPTADGSQKAIKAYRRALELKPTYTRAWVNMGISYSNLSMYDLAAKYYLKSLSLNPTANHVW
eukprot:CAMPEP_0201487384 /NCGR_PEP_ID=MMETSP0151_2-20130828/12744_1 /ASSEMBLY_ACC=CAM_ASM_000257 /TAXON_ID=200890 /ORGANISM="Paramoeba atlantica, Strain 621/1 / CCAP 1560/9" /LENGTH=386 /DNA_ID=CAMNT_0047872399 /DNA_START=71 /DNA_END=1228 /DNA_ORIENTATION=-